MEVTKFGFRMKRHLPITIDSVKLAHTRSEMEEVAPGSWFIAKPKGPYGPLWLRLYHAWLILTNRAIAVQFGQDHYRMAGRNSDGSMFDPERAIPKKAVGQ